MSSRNFEELCEFLQTLEEEEMVGLLSLHRGPQGDWLASTERSVKIYDLPDELSIPLKQFGAFLPAAIRRVEIYMKDSEVDRIKITRSF